MAVAAEAAGASSVWVSDHLLMVDADVQGYPYSGDGRPTWPADVEYYEAFVCCALMAAATATCRIGTAALILPQRNVLEVAKTAMSLDALSNGRLVLGVGAGWHELEMEALGYPFRFRGKRFDEMLDVLHDCWSGRPGPFAGQHVTVPPGVVLSPRPARAGGPPLLVGGMSDAAVRRAATRGDGWLAIAFVATWDARALRERMSVALELSRQSIRSMPFTATLKLHARTAEEVAEVPTLAWDAVSLGFQEVIVEPPWELGLERACELIAETCARVAVAGPC
jgi:probable F420-dependent oxidoreductase